jgi:CubicO group peptidase (beta-lactamase class C family)
MACANLGMALEFATEQSIAELYQAHIFDPQGMEDTFLLTLTIRLAT